MTHALAIHGLTCAYPDRRVLDDVSFSVAPGECFIIIGPNGSGKTTLIKTIAGLLPDRRGEILIEGQSLERLGNRERARKMAYVAQGSDTDTPFSVMELVLMGRAPHLGILGIEGESDRALALQAIDAAGLGRLASRPVNRLSGGERQRAHIARAMCQQSALILLDEPTAALDLAHQLRVMDMLVGVCQTLGTTVVMVSHDINLAAMYADRILLLVDGRTAACGPPETVITETTLSGAYGCPVRVDRSPAGPWPRISLVRGPSFS